MATLSSETVKRGRQARPSSETVKRDRQARPSSETVKRDRQARPSSETVKRACQLNGIDKPTRDVGDRPDPGGAMGRLGRGDRELGMKWRVVLELAGADGTVCVHEVSGGAVVAEYAPRMIGLTLAEGKHLLAAVQHHLDWAQVEDHCRRWRRCQRCGVQRPFGEIAT
jgi:hypothetical protein